MYSSQCISVNVQCTLNTIQQESRIKKVETQQKKKKKLLQMTKSRAFFAQRRIHHAEAIERNKGLCDRCPTCPTALLLVLHITKSHVAIPHIYRFLLGICHTFHSQSKTFHPQVHRFISLSLSFFISTFFHLSLHVLFHPLTFCIQRPSGAGGLSVR